jgi:hypothetical protein
MVELHIAVGFIGGLMFGVGLDRWILPAFVDFTAHLRRHGRR